MVTNCDIKYVKGSYIPKDFKSREYFFKHNLKIVYFNI